MVCILDSSIDDCSHIDRFRVSILLSHSTRSDSLLDLDTMCREIVLGQVDRLG